MRQYWWAVVLVGCMAGGVRAAAQDPQAQPLLQASDVVYEGSVALPSDCGNGQSLNYSSGGLGIGARGLVMNCHDQQRGQVVELSMPAVGRPTTVLVPAFKIPGIDAVDPGNEVKVGGALHYQGRQIFSLYSYYDGDASAYLSHVAVNPANGATSAPQAVGTLGGGYVGGYMGLVPSEWQQLLGGPAFTGQGLLPIISRTNVGPAMFVFDPARVGTTTGAVPIAASLLYYPLSNPLTNTSVQNDLLTLADVIGGAAFPSGTRSVLFIGRHGTGQPFYGEPGRCGGYKGYHACPYVYRVWAYDANDLVKVKNGLLRPWAVKPYANWELKGPNATGTASMPYGGATYDPATRRIILISQYGENPRAYVFKIGAGAPAPPDPIACVVSPWSDWTATSDWSGCAGSQQSRAETRARIVTTPPADGGAGCPALIETRTVAQACTVEPPPALAISCSGTIVVHRDGSWICKPQQ